MPDPARVVVINTTPLIALTAATGNLDVLRALYYRVVVPYEVAEEIRAGGKDAFGLDVFEHASWLEIRPSPVKLPPYLQNSLDRGEASVIHTALQEGVELVCIDEVVGRRIARLSKLSLTGSIGVLLKAKSEGYPSRATCPLPLAPCPLNLYDKLLLLNFRLRIGYKLMKWYWMHCHTLFNL